MYYVDDGCHSETTVPPDDYEGNFQPKYFLAYVRCCTLNGSRCYTHDSCLTPAGLLTFDDAKLKCESYGLRLCTKDELLSDLCCGTGGECDDHQVWTSTPRILRFGNFKLC